VNSFVYRGHGIHRKRSPAGYRDFANIIIGYAFAASGKDPELAPTVANMLCIMSCRFQFGANEPKSTDFPFLPQRDVDDYRIGWELYKKYHPMKP
jgi:hypothetical protein